MVADLGHKGMNGNALFYADLCICCSATACSVGCVCELSLTYVCCNTTQFCSFLLIFGVVLLEVFWCFFLLLVEFLVELCCWIFVVWIFGGFILFGLAWVFLVI